MGKGTSPQKQEPTQTPLQPGLSFGPSSEELEKALRQRTLQCEYTAQALEGFAYSVSHDLRAPLRAIVGFSEALLNEFGTALDPRAREYVERIGKSGDRLNHMVAQRLR